MWKLERTPAKNRTVLSLSGRIQGDHLAELQGSIAAETNGATVVLDLSGVKLIDREVVQFLAGCEKTGIELRHCPAYIREWINRQAKS
jgi:anti-anti-sigma regulatory factor